MSPELANWIANLSSSERNIVLHRSGRDSIVFSMNNPWSIRYVAITATVIFKGHEFTTCQGGDEDVTKSAFNYFFAELQVFIDADTRARKCASLRKMGICHLLPDRYEEGIGYKIMLLDPQSIFYNDGFYTSVYFGGFYYSRRENARAANILESFALEIIDIKLSGDLYNLEPKN